MLDIVPRSSAYKQLRGPWTLLPDKCRAWLAANQTTSCQAARRTQHCSRRTLSPSRSPTSGPSPSHTARGREEAVVSSGPPVSDRGCHQCRSQRSDEATRGRRSERTKIGRECGGATRKQDGGATRGDATTSRRDEATRGQHSERTTIGRECDGAMRGDVTTSWRDEATGGRRSERTRIGQECGGATRG
jgi:hypothetical protein